MLEPVESVSADDPLTQPRRGWASNRFKALAKPGLFLPLGFFLILFITLTAAKVLSVPGGGDTASFMQLAENIANRGLPVSQVDTAVLSLFQSGTLNMPAAEIAKNPLAAPPATDEFNILHYHAYFILYPIAIFTKLFPPDVVLLTFYVLSFVGIVAIAYFVLRSMGVASIAAALFCVLIVTHPAWSEGILFGQFYPDRLFVLCGFVLMYLATLGKTARVWLLIAAVCCMLVNERGALVAGEFLVLYTALYWRKPDVDRVLNIVLGVLLGLYGLFVIKAISGTNHDYSSFLPTSLPQLIANFSRPEFVHGAILFVIINGLFLLFALFEWRAALIAFIIAVPNVIGNLGGAEKVGWITHYHDFYLPALVWAAMLGYAAAYRAATLRKRMPAFYASIVLLVAVVGAIDPYSAARPSVSLANWSNNFIFKFNQSAQTYLSAAGLRYYQVHQQVRNAVPEGVTITTPEGFMALLYHNRTIEFFPLGIDKADYAVVTMVSTDKGPVYGGSLSYLGAAEQAKIDRTLVTRMAKDGYDFAHPMLLEGLPSAAIIRRVHNPVAH